MHHIITMHGWILVDLHLLDNSCQRPHPPCNLGSHGRAWWFSVRVCHVILFGADQDLPELELRSWPVVFLWVMLWQSLLPLRVLIVLHSAWCTPPKLKAPKEPRFQSRLQRVLDAVWAIGYKIWALDLTPGTMYPLPLAPLLRPWSPQSTAQPKHCWIWPL